MIRVPTFQTWSSSITSMWFDVWASLMSVNRLLTVRSSYWAVLTPLRHILLSLKTVFLQPIFSLQSSTNFKATRPLPLNSSMCWIKSNERHQLEQSNCESPPTGLFIVLSGSFKFGRKSSSIHSACPMASTVQLGSVNSSVCLSVCVVQFRPFSKHRPMLSHEPLVNNARPRLTGLQLKKLKKWCLDRLQASSDLR